MRFLSGIQIFALLLVGPVFADCQKIKGGVKSKFEGDSIEGLSIERKSITALNKAYPNLTITEKIFTGNIQSCTDCKDNYVTCSQ